MYVYTPAEAPQCGHARHVASEREAMAAECRHQEICGEPGMSFFLWAQGTSLSAKRSSSLASWSAAAAFIASSGSSTSSQGYMLFPSLLVADVAAGAAATAWPKPALAAASLFKCLRACTLQLAQRCMHPADRWALRPALPQPPAATHDTTWEVGNGYLQQTPDAPGAAMWLEGRLLGSSGGLGPGRAAEAGGLEQKLSFLRAQRSGARATAGMALALALVLPWQHCRSMRRNI